VFVIQKPIKIIKTNHKANLKREESYWLMSLSLFFLAGFLATNWGILPARNVRGSDSRARAPEPQKHAKKSKKSIKGA